MQDDFGTTPEMSPCGGLSPLLGKIDKFKREMKDPKARILLRNEKLRCDLMDDLKPPKRKLIDYTVRKDSSGSDGNPRKSSRPNSLGGKLQSTRLPSVRSIERSFKSSSSLDPSEEKIDFFLKVPTKRPPTRSSSTSSSIEDLRATLRAGRSSTKQKSPLFGSLHEKSPRRKLSLQSLSSADDLESIRRCDSVCSTRSGRSSRSTRSQKRRKSTAELDRLSAAEKSDIDNILARTMNLELSSEELFLDETETLGR